MNVTEFRDIKLACNNKKCKMKLKISAGVDNDFLAFCPDHGHVHTLYKAEVCDVCLQINNMTDISIVEGKKVCCECERSFKSG